MKRKAVYLHLLTRVGLRWFILIDRFICLINVYSIKESKKKNESRDHDSVGPIDSKSSFLDIEMTRV